MDLQLKGKRALVTGSSSGLGAAIAFELAEEGCAVAVHGRDRPRTEQMARAIEKKGVQSVVTVGNLSRDDDAHAIADSALAGLGGIDIFGEQRRGSAADGQSGLARCQTQRVAR